MKKIAPPGTFPHLHDNPRAARRHPTRPDRCRYAAAPEVVKKLNGRTRCDASAT